MAIETKHQDERRKEAYWTLRKMTCVVFFMAAFVWIVLGLGKMISREKIPSSFKSIDAVVVSSDIESNSIGGNNGNTSPSVFYNAVITYTYSVKGETFTSKHAFGNAVKNDPSEAQRIVETYSPGVILPIIYNPDNPEESRISASSFPVHIAMIVAGILCFVLSAVAYLYIPEPAPKAPRITSKTQESSGKKTVPDSIEKQQGGEPFVAPRPAQSLSPEAKGLLGKWELMYQVPSMREIISASNTIKSTLGPDTKAVMSAGAESLSITIGPEEMEFIYLDSKLKGSCDIVSRYTLNKNRLDLEHISMDFMIADVDGFPPTAYIFDLKESKLTLTSNAIKGLGGRPIVYHFTRAEEGKPS